jgi:hypothetical protein
MESRYAFGYSAQGSVGCSGRGRWVRNAWGRSSRAHDTKAKALILVCTKPQFKSLISYWDIAREAWTILEETLQQRSAGWKFATYDELHELNKMKGWRCCGILCERRTVVEGIVGDMFGGSKRGLPHTLRGLERWALSSKICPSMYSTVSTWPLRASSRRCWELKRISRKAQRLSQESRWLAGSCNDRVHHVSCAGNATSLGIRRRTVWREHGMLLYLGLFFCLTATCRCSRGRSMLFSIPVLQITLLTTKECLPSYLLSKIDL